MSIVISLLITMGFLLFYVSAVQTTAAKVLANFIYKETGVKVAIEKVAIRFPSVIVLEEVLVNDLASDTLLYGKKIETSFISASKDWNSIQLGKANLKNIRFYITTSKGDSLTNLDRVIDKISPPDTNSTGTFQLSIAGAVLDSSTFKLYQANSQQTDGVNFDSLLVQNIKAELSNFNLIGDSVLLGINHLSAKESQGLVITEYHGGFTYSSLGMHFNNFQLRTEKSRVDGDVLMTYESPSALADFNNQVTITADLNPSLLILDDLGLFVPKLKSIENDLFIRGNFTGKVSEFQGNQVILEWGESSSFRGNLYTYGLPEIQQTFIDFDVEYLKSNYEDLTLLDILERGDSSLIPQEFEEFGNMQFNGNFTGFVNDFVAFGKLQTKIGTLMSDISVDNTGDTLLYKGDLVAENFDLGAFFNSKNLGKLSTNIHVSGQGITLDRLNAKVLGEVTSLNVKGYKYENITMDGKFESKTFLGELNSLDPNLNLHFNGLVDFNKKIPFFDFTADLFAVNLSELNLIKDTLNASLSGTLTLKGKGDSFQNFDGRADASAFSFCNRDEEFYLGDLQLIASSGASNSIEILSDIGQVKLVGEIEPSLLIDDLNQTLADISSVYFTESETRKKGQQQDFTLELYLNDATIFSGIFDKDFGFDGTLELRGYYKSLTNGLGFTLDCQNLYYGAIDVENLIIEGAKSGTVTDLWINTDRFSINETYQAGKVDFSLKGVADNFQSSILWDNENVTEGSLNSLIEILGKNRGRVDWLPSSAQFGSEKWELNESVQMFWDSTGLFFKNLKFQNKFQELAFQGAVGAKLKDSEFSLQTKNFSLSNFNILTADNPKLEGVANGNLAFSFVEDSLQFNSDLLIKNLALNEKRVGDLSLKSTQMQSKNRIGFDGAISQGNQNGKARFYGYYDAKAKLPLMLNVNFNAFDLAFLDHQFTDDVTEMRGIANGTLDVKGELEAPQITGEINVTNGHVFIPYLQTGFSFTDEIVIRPDYIGLNYIDLIDDNGKAAKLTGTVFHENFSNWNYDVFAELNNNLVINTKKYDNSTFYGTVFASGTIDVAGYGSNTKIEVSAKPEKNTVVYIPLDGVEEIESLDYVEFYNPDDDNEENNTVDLSGLDLSLDLDMNTNAEIQLVFNEAVGDIIKTRGNGLIKMNIDSRSNFEMFGKYEVEDGDYLFTLENLVNKKFNIQQGSSINWFGDPYEAMLDIDAEYRLRAPLYDILASADDRFKRRETVIVQMNLSERLVNPKINFDVFLPNADDFVRGQVNSIMSSEQERNRQVFALLVLLRFVTPLNTVATNEGTRFGGTVGNSTGELISNQVSNIFSQISSDVNVGINYSSGDQLTRSEVALALSTQIFNERVSVTSNLGVTDKTTSNPNGLVGDFSLEYALTKDGKIRLKAFNETADNIYSGSNLSPFIQGVGVSYRTEFDDFKELWLRFKKAITRNKKE